MSVGSSKLALGATSARVPWSWVESVLLGLLALVGADLVIGIISGVVASVFEQSIYFSWIGSLVDSNSVSVNFIYYASARILGVILILKFMRSRGSSLKQFGFRKFKPSQAISLLLLSILLFMAATIVIFVAVEQIYPSANLEQPQEIGFKDFQTPLEVALAFIALVIIAPVVEEALFRGFMLPAFAQSFGRLPAVFITSLLFGAIHWQLNVGIVTFIMGMLMGWMYFKTRSLVPGIMFHSLKNLVALLLIIYKP